MISCTSAFCFPPMAPSSASALSGMALHSPSSCKPRWSALTVTQPLHSAVPRSLIPKNLAGVIHSETVKAADEKLSVVREAGDARLALPSKLLRQSNDHPWQAIVDAAKGQAVRLDRYGIARAARGIRRSCSAARHRRC